MSKNDPPRMITFFDSNTHFEVDIDPAYDIMIPKICPCCLETRNTIYYMSQQEDGYVYCDYHKLQLNIREWKELIRKVPYKDAPPTYGNVFNIGEGKPMQECPDTYCDGSLMQDLWEKDLVFVCTRCNKKYTIIEHSLRVWKGGDNMAWGKFWMVIGRDAQTTSCRHDSKEEAKEEAERLARKEESAFAVLECVEICEPEQAPLTWSKPKEK